MQQKTYGYGRNFTEPGSSGTTFVPGLNRVKMTSIKVEDEVEWGTYKGPAVVAEWTNEEGDVQDGSVTPPKPGSSEKDQRRDFGNVNGWIKHLITAFISDEDYNAKIEELLNGNPGPSFKQYMEYNISLLPPDYTQKWGLLKCGYDAYSEEYLRVPKYINIGCFFALQGETREGHTVDEEFKSKGFRKEPFPLAERKDKQSKLAQEAPAIEQKTEVNF